MFSFGGKKRRVKVVEFVTVKLPFLKLPAFYKGVLLLVTCLIIARLISPRLPSTVPSYQIGDVSDQNIKATQDFLVEDTASTDTKRLENESKSPSVYDFDANASVEVQEKLRSTFKQLRARSQGATTKLSFDEKKEKFDEGLGISSDEKKLKSFITNSFNDSVITFITTLIAVPLSQKVVSDKAALQSEKTRGITIRNVQTQEESFVTDFSSIRGLEEVKKELNEKARKDLRKLSRSLRSAVIDTAKQLIQPTLTFNKNETEARKLMAREEANPVYFKLKKGEILIREGDRITEETLLKLQALNQFKQESNPLFSTIGIFFLVLIIVSLFYAFFPGSIRKFNLKGKDYILLSLVLIGMVIIVNFSTFLSGALSKAFPFLPYNACLYATPFALGAILIAIVLNVELAAMFSVALSIISGIVLENQLKFFIFPFIASIVAAQQVVLCKERSTLIRAGLITGVVNVLLLLCFAIINRSLFNFEALFDLSFGFLGGLLTGIIATGIVPIIEITFDYTTNNKLLELADLNQPLLKELSIKAPGTYQHSIMVGNLVDSAAEAVGANSLLARVSAYYHDIGKVKKATYFVENQIRGENKHEKLSPSMSSLILLAHVKDGVELAKEKRLGGAIREIIRQHHGTSLISFFYQKAKNQKNPSLQPISEKDFRYPGPRPQTKEAALVMLADAVEAASKTLGEPTPARIQGMVQKIINGIFIDGQLDECELTLKNLHGIANCFNRIMTSGVFHQRVEYPALESEENGSKRKINGKDKKSAETDKDQQKVDRGDNERDLKRLGISKVGNKHSSSG
jgi:putative nucleotidyltransferase with HDIG domain